MNIQDYVKISADPSSVDASLTRNAEIKVEYLWAYERHYLRMLEYWAWSQRQTPKEIPTELFFLLDSCPKDAEVARGVVIKDVRRILSFSVEPVYFNNERHPTLGVKEWVPRKNGASAVTIVFEQYVRPK